LRQEAGIDEEPLGHAYDDSSIANFVLFYNEDEINNPQAYDHSYSKLLKWVDESIDIYKVKGAYNSMSLGGYCILFLCMHI
jgi:transcription initiation factor TFIID subunit 5